MHMNPNHLNGTEGSLIPTLRRCPGLVPRGEPGYQATDVLDCAPEAMRQSCPQRHGAGHVLPMHLPVYVHH